MPRASVIVPARDAHETLPRTLAAIAGQILDGGFEVIVVDDGSRDDTAALARAAPGAVTVLSQPPLGPAAARDRAVRAASSSRLAFCDADVFPAPGWLEAGVAALERSDLVQGKVLPDPTVKLGPFDRSLWITEQRGLWETANLFVRRECYERVGGFEEWLVPRRGKALAEDVWFGHKAIHAGARVAYCEAALAHHAVFRRGWREYVAEYERLRYFPAMVRKMPELRQTLLHRRVFLNSRSASFDIALASAVCAAALRSPLPLIGAGPYLRRAARDAQRARPRGPEARVVAAVDLLADVRGLAALVAGSAGYRALVI
jgi:glycosyltransferase involved in cell wall biosynthesis